MSLLSIRGDSIDVVRVGRSIEFDLRSVCGLDEMWSRRGSVTAPQPVCEPRGPALWGGAGPCWCGAADSVDDGAGSVGNGVAAPGHMVVGADENEVPLIQRAGVLVADVYHLQ